MCSFSRTRKYHSYANVEAKLIPQIYNWHETNNIIIRNFKKWKYGFFNCHQPNINTKVQRASRQTPIPWQQMFANKMSWNLSLQASDKMGCFMNILISINIFKSSSTIWTIFTVRFNIQYFLLPTWIILFPLF